jgi:acetyl esterase/lipase
MTFAGRMALILAMVGGVALAQDSSVGTIAPKDAASVEILWPNGAPGAVGKDFDDVPKLYCYPATGDGPHAAVVVLPGGGYNHLVMEKEGAVEARWLNAHGVSAYVLQYRLSPRYLYPAAMLDGAEAMRFVRAHAVAWKIRPDAVGVWGFSAGGHLAGYLATLSGDASAHPDFAVISYGRLDLDSSIPGTFGMETLTGKDAPQALVDTLSPVLHVTKATSPSFIYATEFDEKVDSRNATAFYDALHRAGVPAELHVFEQGPHGTGMGQKLAKAPELAIWPVLLEHWMQVHGWIAGELQP